MAEMPPAGALPPRTNEGTPTFARDEWPHFHGRGFLALYDRYAQITARLEHRCEPADRPVTLWWRRTWEGAIARPCELGTAFTDPPFGIAEWLAFAAATRDGLAGTISESHLIARFDHDLVMTWQAWARLLRHLRNRADLELTAFMVPPRACWLGSPPEGKEAPALGFP